MRIPADILLFVAAFFLPWWLVLLAASILFFFYDRFYELPFFALFMDFLYAMPSARLGGFEFVLAIGAIGLFLILEAVKKRMRV